MRTNFVLIDYENVQPEAMLPLEREPFRVLVFVGANQSKLTFDIASVLQRMGDRAQYIKISGNGSNALDFHIAYYIGRLAAGQPDAYFHIVSKDAGFDPLIAHLKTQGIFCGRVRDVSEIPATKAANANSREERLAVIVGDLKRRGASRPRSQKTLASTINALFQKQLSESDVAALLGELERQGVSVVNESKVSYSLPT